MKDKLPKDKYPDDEPVPRRNAGQLPDELLPGQTNDESASSSHAVGTPGGGAAGGGLGGTNLGDGSPDEATNLDDAMGSGIHDHVDDTVSDDQPQSGSAGGAVGGTPAGKRVKPRQRF